ncbi:hypothetical protein EXIGLDRAFT_453199 [Exidia glandulosa HHB12029]|uniref:Uncharacterized protein n=1 Tax=Exidia glandulosa HHB12029 TaxID=1314781 RepID=A0A165K7E6_EXIGL|nr:hypothetical protein EXIGLDRAFT_453199 [Exidia glandulosa HHB12029]
MRLQFLLLTASVTVSLAAQNAFFVALAPGPLRLVHPDVHAHTHGYNHNHTRTLSRRDVKLVPAAKCDAAAPSPCEATDAFCCAESTQCRARKSSPTSKTQWLCVHKGELDSAMECGASDTPCNDGVSCCPEDMSCAAEGGCVAEMSPADGDGDEEGPGQEGACVDGETPCVNACCTEKETCHVATGVCMAAIEAGADSPAPAPAGAAPTNTTNTSSSVASNTNTHAALVTVTAVPMPNTGHDGAGSVGLLVAVLGVTFMASLA